MQLSPARQRAAAFCERFGLSVPVLLAPMAGIPAPALSVAVGGAGGMSSAGVVLMPPQDILAWADQVRAAGPFQLNTWIPDPPPARDAAHEARLRAFLAGWGPAPAVDAGDAVPPDFALQCDAMLAARPAAISSVMGVYPAAFVARMKQAGIAWIANISTLGEALRAEAAGADVIAAQGWEAGGHRGCFDAADGARRQVGLAALIPAVADAVRLPVVAAGGIADGRGVAAALALGASAVQIGTGFLRCPEAGLATAWEAALGRTAPEDTVVSRAFSGRWGRSIATGYVAAATAPGAPEPAPYPVQRGLTAAMRHAAAKADDLAGMQAWAGQSAALASTRPAGEVVRRVWEGALEIVR